MAEAVGVVASVITIAGLAYHGSKKLHEALDKYKNAPKNLTNLRTELDIVQQLLQSIKKNLANTRDEDLPEALQLCLQDFKPSLEGLKLGCDEFLEKLKKLTNHSTDSDMSKRDRFKLQFEEKSIEAFRYRLSSHKLSTNIVLGLINYASSKQSRQVLDDLEKNITTAMNKISGQLEGLEITVQSLGSTESLLPQGQALESLREQEIALGQCLKVCTSAVEAAPSGMKTAIETMESFEEAKQLVVLTKGGHGLIGAMVARGSSRQMFMDTVKEGEESKIVNDFFK